MKERLFLSAPHMSGNEQKYIDEVFKSNYIAPTGAYINKFEASICDYTGAKNALAVTCGTAAIHLALRVLGIGKNDDVLASTFTFIGSVTPILYQNANPVFIDSERESWNLDPILLKKYLEKCEKKPKALIVTHLYGQSVQIEEIAALCKEYGVYLIEDAAESLGATYNGKHTGTFGDFGIYSFNGNKILTTSGGGMLVSDNKEWIKKAQFYSTQAKENKLYYEHIEYGYNYRMSNVLAAIGVAQMEVIEERVHKKREIFEWYQEELKDLDIEWMQESAGSHGNRWLTTALFKKSVNIDKIINLLDQNACESRPLWKPMHLQPLFKESQNVLNGVSEDLFQRGLCLPSGTQMNRNDVNRVCGLLRSSVENSYTMKILLTGSSGFIGSYFQSNYNDRYDIETFSFLEDDLDDLDLTQINTVVHLSALVHQMDGAAKEEYFRVNVDNTLALAQKAKQSSVKQFIFMSSVKVYGEESDTPYTETSKCDPQDDYSKSKLEAENRLKELEDDEFTVSIIRTPVVYGKEVKSNMLNLAKMAINVPVLPFGNITNRRSMVYIGNLCDMIERLCESKMSGIFLAGDDQPISTTKLIETITKAKGGKAILLNVPLFPQLLRRVKPSLHKKLYGNLEVDNRWTKKVLDFENKVSTEDGIQKMMEELQ